MHAHIHMHAHTRTHARAHFHTLHCARAAPQVLKLLVPEKETGNVIGRGGERLKEIRTATGSQT